MRFTQITKVGVGVTALLTMIVAIKLSVSDSAPAMKSTVLRDINGVVCRTYRFTGVTIDTINATPATGNIELAKKKGLIGLGITTGTSDVVYSFEHAENGFQVHAKLRGDNVIEATIRRVGSSPEAAKLWFTEASRRAPTIKLTLAPEPK